MRSRYPNGIRAIILPWLSLAMALLLACSSAATATPEPTSTAAPQQDTVEPTLAPTAEPTATQAPMVSTTEGPTGTLNIAYSQLGPPRFLPKLTGSPQASINLTTVWESLWAHDAEGNVGPRLVKEWEVSDDGLVWTLRLQEGVSFHKGKGEFTAEDMVWSLQNYTSEGSIAGRVAQIEANYFASGGGMTIIDDHTVEVDTSGSGLRFDFTWYATQGTLPGPVPMMSKDHIQALGEETAGVEDPIGTGPWQHVEHKANEIWRLEAVRDHWRKTPNFAELNIREIAEESTRVANFQSGNLDSMHMNLETMKVLEGMEGVKFQRLRNGSQLHLNLHGQMYADRPDLPTPRNSDLPWISANPDTASREWELARKVREAMSIALDRELIAEQLLSGLGRPNSVFAWMGHENRLELQREELAYQYDPERARTLLEEAGYGDGFEIQMALTTRPFPGTVEVGEIACVMWEEIGIRCQQTRMPMSAFRPNFIDRSWAGVNTHGVDAQPEPLAILSTTMRAQSVINYGIEHPWLQEKIGEAQTIIDEEARFEVQREIAQWVFDNVVILPTVIVNAVYPLGPRIDEWEWPCCGTRVLKGLEYIPPPAVAWRPSPLVGVSKTR